MQALLAAAMARKGGPGGGMGLPAGMGLPGAGKMGTGNGKARVPPPKPAPKAMASASQPADIDRTKPPDYQWHQAAKLGDLNLMKSLYESKPELLKHHQKGIGHTALHWSSCWIPCVEWLLENGASVHELNSSDATPLHPAAGGSHLAIVQRLLKAGADQRMTTATRRLRWRRRGVIRRWRRPSSELL